MTIRALLRALGALLTSNLDILIIAGGLLVAQPLVPTGSLLARPDLAAWTALVVGLVSFARGAPLGPGAHPMLTARVAGLATLARRLALALVPCGLVAWYDTTAAPEDAVAPWLALGVSATVGVLLLIGRRSGETAWDPPGIGTARVWALTAIGLVTATMALGRTASLGVLAWARLPGLISLSFFAVGLAAGRTSHLRQRLAAGRRDGKRVWGVSFGMVLAAFGPGLGLLVLSLAYAATAGHPLGFEEVYVITIFACSWSAILWRPRPPVAVGVLLHEVVPEGGHDPKPEDAAVGFDRPPEGALRFTPIRLRRTRSVHPWIVPVRHGRIEDLDDPVAPLWAPPLPFHATHALGHAAFEPNAVTGTPQWAVITVRMGAGTDTMTVSEQDAQSRRIVVLRAFPRLSGARRAVETYRWQSRIPAECVQVVDATTEVIQLIEGDVIVLSSEGVARAYEVEIGAALVADAEFASYRPPQIEDYHRVRG